MPHTTLLSLASGLRTRAEQIMAKAETSDADAQEMMRAVAANYEKLAQQVEQQADEAKALATRRTISALWCARPHRPARPKSLNRLRD
jgi:hypothetical protein